MTLQRGFEEPGQFQNGWVAIGNFDGVHKGHQSMIQQLLSHSQEQGGPAVILTFEPHPIRLLRPEQTPPSLSTLERKSSLLNRYGIDVVIAYPTDRDLLRMSPREFFDEIVIRQLKARGLVEGPNFYFGKNRSGDVELLGQFCEEAGVRLDVIKPVESGGGLVSSSLVRRCISEGRMADAIGYLGHPYQMRGTVVRGDQRGRQLGFPTANLEQVETLVPAPAVYAACVEVDAQQYPAAVHVGPLPTFDEMSRRIEVHILDYSGDLYGQELSVDFLDQVREVEAFDSVDALKHQLTLDIAKVRSIVG